MLSRALSKSSPWPSIKSSPERTNNKNDSTILPNPMYHLHKHESESKLTHDAAFSSVLIRISAVARALITSTIKNDWSPKIPLRIMVYHVVICMCWSTGHANNNVRSRNGVISLMPGSTTKQPSEHYCPCHWSNAMRVSSRYCFENDFYTQHTFRPRKRNNNHFTSATFSEVGWREVLERLVKFGTRRELLDETVMITAFACRAWLVVWLHNL